MQHRAVGYGIKILVERHNRDLCGPCRGFDYPIDEGMTAAVPLGALKQNSGPIYVRDGNLLGNDIPSAIQRYVGLEVHKIGRIRFIDITSIEEIRREDTARPDIGPNFDEDAIPMHGLIQAAMAIVLKPAPA
jgi:hypothetical protein